jgi:steroid delta-isomerase-like uncharacterized protein
VENANERLLRRFFEAIVNRGEVDLLATFVAGEHVGHDPLGDHYGPEGVRISIEEFRTAFPNLNVTIEDIVANGDRVASRYTLRGTHDGPYMGMAATGRRVVATGLGIDRFIDEKIVESWTCFDALGILRQFGVVPNVVRRQGYLQRELNDPTSE